MSDAENTTKLPGMKAFYVMWVGQFVSIFASRMTGFAITLWAWDLTGSATALVLVGVAHSLPGAIFSPFAGALDEGEKGKGSVWLGGNLAKT